MNDRNMEPEIAAVKDARPLDEALRILWQRIRTATESLARLREENSSMRQLLQDMERQVASLRGEGLRKDEELKRLRAEQVHARSNDGSSGFAPEEKEILKARIREMIAKINSHLQ